MSTEVRVYRLEDSSQKGPYGVPGAVLDHNGHPHRPRTDQDGLPQICELEHLHFAFGSELAIFDWFDETDLVRMSGFGFGVSVYRVDAGLVMYGHCQCAFDLASSMLVDTIEISDLIERRLLENAA